ncbi:MAG: hypothetical protein ACLUKE_06775 [Blautia wexlerae]
MMIPNEAFLKYFPDAVLSGMEDRTERSSLSSGWYICFVIHKIVSDYSLDKLLGQFFSERDMALLLDLPLTLLAESNVAWHYPDYAAIIHCIVLV